MTPRIEIVWGGFYHRVDHRLIGVQPWRVRDGGWVYPPGGGCDGGGGITGDGDLRLPPPEQSRTVYYDQAHYLPVPGGV